MPAFNLVGFRGDPVWVLLEFCLSEGGFGQMGLVKLLNSLVHDRSAVTAIEYALIAALIAVVIITAVSTLGVNVGNTFNTVASEL